MLLFLVSDDVEFTLCYDCLQFRNCTYSDVMKNYPADDGLAVAARLALFFTLIFSYPVLMNPCRDSMNSLCLLLLRNCTRSRWFAVKEEEEMPETTNELHVCTLCYTHTHILFVHNNTDECLLFAFNILGHYHDKCSKQ